MCKLIWAYVCYENYSLRKLNTSFLKRLKEHKENVHGIEYDKSHLNNVCEECGKVFESVKKLNRHRIDIHVNLAMMKCPHCPKEWSKNYIFKFNWVGINDINPNKRIWHFLTGYFFEKFFSRKLTSEKFSVKFNYILQHFSWPICFQVFWFSTYVLGLVIANPGSGSLGPRSGAAVKPGIFSLKTPRFSGGVERFLSSEKLDSEAQFSHFQPKKFTWKY